MIDFSLPISIRAGQAWLDYFNPVTGVLISLPQGWQPLPSEERGNYADVFLAPPQSGYTPRLALQILKVTAPNEDGFRPVPLRNLVPPTANSQQVRVFELNLAGYPALLRSSTLNVPAAPDQSEQSNENLMFWDLYVKLGEFVYAFEFSAAQAAWPDLEPLFSLILHSLRFHLSDGWGLQYQDEPDQALWGFADNALLLSVLAPRQWQVQQDYGKSLMFRAPDAGAFLKYSLLQPTPSNYPNLLAIVEAGNRALKGRFLRFEILHQERLELANRPAYFQILEWTEPGTGLNLRFTTLQAFVLAGTGQLFKAEGGCFHLLKELHLATLEKTIRSTRFLVPEKLMRLLPLLQEWGQKRQAQIGSWGDLTEYALDEGRLTLKLPGLWRQETETEMVETGVFQAPLMELDGIYSPVSFTLQVRPAPQATNLAQVLNAQKPAGADVWTKAGYITRVGGNLMEFRTLVWPQLEEDEITTYEKIMLAGRTAGRLYLFAFQYRADWSAQLLSLLKQIIGSIKFEQPEGEPAQLDLHGPPQEDQPKPSLQPDSSTNRQRFRLFRIFEEE